MRNQSKQSVSSHAKVCEAVSKRREIDRALGILVDEDDDACSRLLEVDPVFFRQSTK